MVAKSFGFPMHKASVRKRDGSFHPLPGMKSVDKGESSYKPSNDQSTGCVYMAIAAIAWSGLSSVDRGLRLVTMLYAGRQAELIHAAVGLPAGAALVMPDPDHGQASIILAEINQRQAAGYCQRWARHLLTSNWHEVETIANRLKYDGEVIFQ